MLTEEQKLMVEQNHNLIYWYISLSNLDIDEWYDLLAIELCYAVQKYDPERGSLGNYFKLRADDMVYKEYRKRLTQKRKMSEVQLNENLESDEFVDDLESELDNMDWVNDENREILKLRLQGFSQNEIAEKIGLSQSFVSKELKRIKETIEWK